MLTNMLYTIQSTVVNKTDRRRAQDRGVNDLTKNPTV